MYLIPQHFTYFAELMSRYVFLVAGQSEGWMLLLILKEKRKIRQFAKKGWIINLSVHFNPAK